MTGSCCGASKEGTGHRANSLATGLRSEGSLHNQETNPDEELCLSLPGAGNGGEMPRVHQSGEWNGRTDGRKLLFCKDSLRLAPVPE